ncbi:MAG: aminotransferase class V-fold PLP-dependent enzyme [Blastomonas sp.]
MANHRIYLDHAATTPVVDAARHAFARGMEQWANPSSPHLDGRGARSALEDARRRIASALGWDGEVILTGGASEAIAMAMLRSRASRWIISPVEHDAVLRLADRAGERPVSRLAVDLAGRLVMSSLDRALDGGSGKPLVIVQAANNESGVLQDISAIAAKVREAGGLLFADCAQTAGKLPLPDADLIAVSAHKLGGPPGIGTLLVRDLAALEPSGGQEKGYRPGTENLPGAMAFAAALEAPKVWLDRARDLRHQLDKSIRAAGGEIVAAEAPRIPTIGGYRMPGVSANAQLIQFDLSGISVSAGSACSSGTLKASHVLTAMGWDDVAAGEVVRVSFGPGTSRAHVYRFVEIWQSIHAKARAA